VPDVRELVRGGAILLERSDVLCSRPQRGSGPATRAWTLRFPATIWRTTGAWARSWARRREDSGTDASSRPGGGPRASRSAS